MRTSTLCSLCWPFATIVFLVISSYCQPTTAQQTDSPDTAGFHREIFVPFDSLDVLLDGNSNRVLMTRTEYAELLKAAKVREIKKSPVDSAIISAKYSSVLSDGVAHITGELVVEPLNEGWIQIPLSLSGVAVRSAELDDQPAKLWRDLTGQLVLLVSGTERKTLRLDMTLPLQTSAARQTMSLQLPAPTATNLSLNVPGNVEVKSGAAVVRRDYDEANNKTEFELLPTKEPMSIVMSLNNRLLKDDQVVVSRSVVIHKLTPHRQEIHETCSVDVIHGAIEEVSFVVPTGFEVSSVATELLNSWEIVAAENGEQHLLVKLRQPTREPMILNIMASRDSGVTGAWSATDIRPLDVAGHITVVGVLADVGLKSSDLQSDGLIPIDHQFLMAAIPPSLTTTNTDSPVSVVAAYYAPQREYEITANFFVPEPELIVKSSSRLVVSDQQLEIHGGLSLISKFDSRFDFKISLPPQWRLNELTDVDGTAIRFDRLNSEDDAKRVEFLVHLTNRIAPDAATRVFFKASQTPDNWLEEWETNSFEFPNVLVVGQSKQTGVLAVTTREDVLLKPKTVTGLDVLDESDKQQFEFERDNAPLAYRFKDASYALEIDVERLKPSITARGYNFVMIQPNQLQVHAELIFEVKLAGESEFQFDLPLESPASISIQALDLRMKDFRSEELASARRWIVQLAKPTKGKVHLLVDYQMPLADNQRTELKLTPVLIRDVSFQSAMVAIEGSSELDIEIKTDARAVDVGEFSEARYQSGRHTLGAFSAPSEDIELIIASTRRPVYELPAAIAQHAEMVTSISNNGRSQTAAKFLLATKQQPFLRIELPTNSSLWSVRLDGQPAKPQRRGDALLISLVGNETGRLRELQLVFESPVTAFNLVGEIEAEAPLLWLSESDSETGIPVPLVDLHWRLLMPDGFSVSHGDGNFQSDHLGQQPSPIQQLGRWIVWLGGGFRNTFIHQRVTVTAAMNSATDEFLSPAANAPMSGTATQTEHFQRSDNAFSKKQSIDGKMDALQSQTADLNISGEAMGVRPSERNSDSDSDMAMSWALSGLRSLNIELTDTGNSIEFYSLGEQNMLRATVVNQSRLNWFAIALALLIAGLGALLTNGRFRSKAFFLLLILVVAGFVPLLGSTFDALRTLIDLAILAVVFVTIYFVVIAIAQTFFRSLGAVATRLPMLMLFISITLSFGHQTIAQQVVNDADELRRLITELQSDKTVVLPDNAIIIPFDANDPDGRSKAEKMLLPYEHYLKLIGAAALLQPSKRGASGAQVNDLKPPVDYVISSADYEITLALDDDVSILGKLVIDVLTDEAISVELPLAGGALADATVNGLPARLQFGSKPNPAAEKSQSKKPAAGIDVVQLHLEGRGKKKFEFTVRSKPQRAGGWRLLTARLPVGITRGLNLKTLAEATEIRLNTDADQRSVETKPNQELATVLSVDGSLRLQWKPSTAQQTIDQSLTANSAAILDVREDGLRLTWNVELDFRGSEREMFTLALPEGFLVEQIHGENIRAWDAPKNSEQNRLNVTLLSPAKDRESFTVDLSQRDFSIAEKPTSFDAPYLNVEGAALHKGVLMIRRSPIIEIKTTGLTAANRIDQSDAVSRIDVASIDAKSSPLGIEPFQLLQFVTTPFRVGFQAQLIPPKLTATTQSILRIGQSEANLESRINLSVGQRPIYELSFDLPADAEIRRLSAGMNEIWTTETIDEKQQVRLFFPSGVADDFSIIVEAGLTAFSGGDEWTIPSIKINDVEQQTGEIAIQVDPAIAVTTSNLINCEAVLLQQVERWLNPDQRSKTRVSLRTKGSEYHARLKFSKIDPRVTVETVTNIRTTLFAIEETILLDFDIQQAGIRQIQFEIPVEMRNARIVAKLVSESIIENIVDNPRSVRVTLNLQDDVIDSYRVVVENDRQLSDTPQQVPIPRVLTGTTEFRFATLQNAGRDEIEVLPATDFLPLNRQLSQFAKLKQKLAGGELTMAYVANSNADFPELQFETKQRESFDTVAASIEFSKTTMVVDSSGAYRALQNFQINNRSEQYLEIELPAGASLLTVVVAGQPIKPVAWPAAQHDRRLRVPLVKTPAGDLDYSVQLKYAGQLGELGSFQSVSFPVIETLNINVQLSQLHLHLPESHQWINFDGTMTKVDGRGELEESFLSYKAKQIQQLAEQIQSEASSFGSSYSKSRAFKNLKKLEDELSGYESANGVDPRQSNQKLKALIKGNADAIRQAQQNYSVEASKSSESKDDNRTYFNELVDSQSAKLARNSVTRGGQNFYHEDEPQDVAKSEEIIQQELDTGGFGDGDDERKNESRFGADRTSGRLSKSFDESWLSRNKLEGQQQGGGQGGNQDQSRPELESSARYKANASNLQQFPATLSAIIPQAGQTIDDSISFSNSTDRIEEKAKNQLYAQNNEEEKRIADKESDQQEQPGTDPFYAQSAELGPGSGLGGRSSGIGGFGGGAADGPEEMMGEKFENGKVGDYGVSGRFEDRGRRLFAGRELTESESIRDEQLAAPTVPARAAKEAIAAAALTSLDIELPSRGTDYYFKSPRGKATVSARPLETRSIRRWTAALGTLGICLGFAIASWLVVVIWRSPTLRFLGTGALLLAGLISVGSLTLPFYGLIAIAAAVVLLVHWISKSLLSGPVAADQ